MTGVLGGLVAALCWGGATLCGSRASRIAGAAPALAWQALIGAILVLPMLLTHMHPVPQNSQWWLLLIAGIALIVGLLMEFQGFRYGPVAVVATLASLEGAVAALLSMATGERPPSTFLAVVPVLLIGLIMVTLKPEATHFTRQQWTKAIACGVGSGIAFGLSLFTTGRVSQSVNAIWAVAPSRFLGVAALTLPLLIRGTFRIPKQAIPWIVASGVGDTIGFLAFAFGSTDGISIAAVLASQFAVVTTVLAALVFKEKLSFRQNAGVLIVAVGVAAIAGLRSGG